MEANGDMLADEDAESAHIGAPGEDLIGGLKDRKGCEGDCCDSEACSKEEEEEPPVDDEFASDDDGWAWK
jgi:hypothetical protein